MNYTYLSITVFYHAKAQKELLDAELDFHKKLTSGEDTTDLKRRLGQLQVEVSRHFVTVTCTSDRGFSVSDGNIQREG